jgi:hypothetical protein
MRGRTTLSRRSFSNSLPRETVFYLFFFAVKLGFCKLYRIV